jgi:hypothetical protein
MPDTPGTTPSELAGLLLVKPDDGSADAGSGGVSDTPAAQAGGETDGADWDADAEAGNLIEGQEAADAGTDDADAPDSDTEAAGADPDQQAGDDEPRYTVTIDGEEKQVSLKEALAGYQRTEDYTRKTQQIAAERQALADEAARVAANRDQYAASLQALQEHIGPESKEPTAAEWDALRGEDPDRFAVEWADFQRRQEARKTVKAEQERVANEKQAEQSAQFKQFVDGQRDLLMKAFPEWKEPKKFNDGVLAIRTYAKTAGFTDVELDNAYDHRVLVLADKARRFDDLMAKREKVQKRLDNAPDMPAPSGRSHAPTRKQAAKADAQKRFDRSGKIDDAIPLLMKG